jgi:threonine/homoserine/homoserine lactone efflux protein
VLDTILKLGGIAVTAFIVGLSGALMPGPLLAVTVDESARRGAKAGPLLILGHMLLEGALVAGLVFGLGTLLAHRLVIGVIGIVGGAGVCWMGQGMLRSVGKVSLQATASARSRLHPVAAGIIVSLSNPYWTLWWATIGAGYVVMGLRFGLPGILAFFVGHILADFAWYTLVSVGIARGRRFISDRVYRGLVAVCGVALVAFGVWFVWSGGQAMGRGQESGVSGDRPVNGE